MTKKKINPRQIIKLERGIDKKIFKRRIVDKKSF